ncbi:type II secretion system protein [Nitratifractor sp.]
MIRLKQRRPGFSMVTAIFVIVIMATVAMFILNLTSKTVQETTAQYRKEQAILYAKSYTEYAVMLATAKKCIRKLSANIDGDTNQVKRGQGYRVEVYIQYLGANSTCTNKIGTTNIVTPASIDNIILVDTYVHYRNPDSPSAINASAWSTDPGITYHRRTLQRL